MPTANSALMQNSVSVLTPAEGASSKRLAAPDTVARGRVDWPYAGSFGLYHALALLAVMPWLFSWTGLTICLLGTYVFGTLGINLCP